MIEDIINKNIREFSNNSIASLKSTLPIKTGKLVNSLQSNESNPLTISGTDYFLSVLSKNEKALSSFNKDIDSFCINLGKDLCEFIINDKLN